MLGQVDETQEVFRQGWIIGLVVTGGSWPRGCEFESGHRIIDEFFTFIFPKIKLLIEKT